MRRINLASGGDVISSESPRLQPSRLLYTAIGVLLGLGAPVGWLGFRLVTRHLDWVLQEINSYSLLYAYMAVGTAIAFGLFGFILGRRDDRLLARTGDISRALSNATSLALSDGLTGLSNARYVHDQLAREIDLARRYDTTIICLMLDIDDFKRVNDTYGHAVGDSVLQNVSTIIRRCIRQVDIAGRLGGEEFVVVMRRANSSAAVPVAERIRQGVESFRFGSAADAPRVTVSIGLAIFPGTGIEDEKALLKSADIALYQAKRTGKNRTVVHGATAAAAG